MKRIVVAALSFLLLAPGVAHAGGTVRIEGDRLVFDGTATTDKVIIGVLNATQLYALTFGTDPSLGPATAGPGCSSEPQPGGAGNRIVCPRAGITAVVANFGGGDDWLSAFMPKGAAIEQRADMGPGDDVVDSPYIGGTFALDDGDDRVNTAHGDATIDAGTGDDDLLCGDRSRASRELAAYEMDGGVGDDRI
jgi:hypothetical protein